MGRLLIMGGDYAEGGSLVDLYGLITNISPATNGVICHSTVAAGIDRSNNGY